MLRVATRGFLVATLFAFIKVLLLASPTLSRARFLTLVLSGVVLEVLHNNNYLIKRLNSSPIELHLYPILQPIFKVKEELMVRHDDDFQHQGSELLDVV